MVVVVVVVAAMPLVMDVSVELAVDEWRSIIATHVLWATLSRRRHGAITSKLASTTIIIQNHSRYGRSQYHLICEEAACVKVMQTSSRQLL